MKHPTLSKFTSFNSLSEMLPILKDEKRSRIYFEYLKWSGDQRCPFCNSQDYYRLKTRGEFKGMYKCSNCMERYTATCGTVIEGTKIPLSKWLIASYIFSAHKKGISSAQLARDLSITQKSAWYMLHRLRFGITSNAIGDQQLEGRIELDETFVGGKNKNRHAAKKVKNSQGRSFKDKTPVMGMLQEQVFEIIERPNKIHPEKVVKEKVIVQQSVVRCKVVPNTQSESLQPIIKEHVHENSVVISDEWMGYAGLNEKYDHRIVDHTKHQYVTSTGDSSNAMEGFWTSLKRSYIGIYHHMSRKHMQSYADEVAFRYNTRAMKNGERLRQAVSLMNGRITYKRLIKKS